MKKVFIATTILVLCVLITSCGEPTPTIKTVPAPAADTWSQQTHQAGEVQIAPGESFTVSLTPDTDLNRVWEESPEIINPSVVEKVDYKNESSPGVTPRQTWTFKGLAKGSCVILFKTSGQEDEMFEWTYSLYIGVKSLKTSTFPVTFTSGNSQGESYDIKVNATTTTMIYTESRHFTYDIHGTMEGKIDGTGKSHIDLKNGKLWIKQETTFVGTVNSKSGSYVTQDFAWGVLDSATGFTTGWVKDVRFIISGTGELANLRGVIYGDSKVIPAEPPTDPPASTIECFGSGTLWFFD